MIKFGPSGSSIKYIEEGHKKTEEMPLYLKNMGLDCFEYSFGRGVNLGEKKAESIKEAFTKENIEISVHAPYFINLSNVEEESAEKSFKYILDSAVTGKLMGADRVIFHPASQGKQKREKAVSLAIERFKRLTDLIYKNNLQDVKFCPETMGKSAQIGTIEEIVEFCKIDKVFTPCVDFGHVNARECGSLKTEKDYQTRLEYMIDNLGYEKMKDFHVHFSKIEFTSKGEVRHLTFLDTKYGPNFEPLSNVLKNLALEPHVLCESAGTQDVDALKMKNIYFGD